MQAVLLAIVLSSGSLGSVATASVAAEPSEEVTHVGLWALATAGMVVVALVAALTMRKPHLARSIAFAALVLVFAVAALPGVGAVATSPAQSGEATGVSAATAGGTFTARFMLSTGTCAGTPVTEPVLGTTYNVCIWGSSATSSDHYDITTLSIYVSNSDTVFVAYGASATRNENTWIDAGDFTPNEAGTFRLRIEAVLQTIGSAVTLATVDSDSNTNAANRGGYVRVMPVISAIDTYKSDCTTADNQFPTGEPMCVSFTVLGGVASGNLIANAGASTGREQELVVVGKNAGATTLFSAKVVYTTSTTLGADVTSSSYGTMSTSRPSATQYRVSWTPTTGVTNEDMTISFATVATPTWTGVAWAPAPSTTDTFLMRNTLVIVSPTATPQYVNRGEATTLAGTVNDFWGQPLASKAVTVVEYNGGTGSNVVATTTSAAGAISVAWTPTSGSADTYGSTTPSVAEARNYGYHVSYAGGISSGTSVTTVFDVDANYYLSSSTRAWATSMRNDQQRVTATIVGVRSQAITHAASVVTVEYLDGGGVQRGVCSVSLSAGVTQNCDLTISNAASSAPAGTWTSRYTITSQSSTNSNGMAATNGLTFVVSATIGLSAGTLDVDVAGLSTTKYFNRGQTVRTAATLLHADGGVYNRKMADGTTQARGVAVHFYQTTSGSAGSFTSPSASVDGGTGVVLATSTDVAVSTTAGDTYASATPNVGEAVNGDLAIIDGGAAGDSDGNRFTQLDFYDIDANYYLSSSTRAWATVMRNDQQRVTGTIVGVRSQTVPDTTPVTVDYVDGGSVNRGSCSATTSTGVTSNCDVTISNTDASAPTGTWTSKYTVVAGAGTSQNSMATTNGLTFVVSRLFSASGLVDIDVAGSSTTKYFNRGETVRTSATLLHADGGFYRRLLADGTTQARSVTVHLYADTAGGAGSVTSGAASVGVSTGIIVAASTDVALDGAFTDTYVAATHSQAESTGADMLIVDGGLATDADGNRLGSFDLFDVDANYYVASSTRAWATLMRGDQQRVTGTIVGVRGQAVPNTTPVTVDYVDGGSVNRGTCSATTTSGVTSSCDVDISNTATSSPVGTWTSKYTVAASAGTSQNGMATTNGQTFAVSATIGISVTPTVDVAGQSTTDYFNRGETVRATFTLTHAGAGAYNRKMADGTTQARSVGTHYYSTTRGETGSFTDAAATISASTGAVTASETDVAVSSTATDTYTTATPGSAEAKGWSLYIFDGGSTTDANGNAAAVTASLLDVDANYYNSGNSIHDAAINRGDTVRVTETFIGVRSQNVPDGVTVRLQWRNPSDVGIYSTTKTTVSGVSSNYDQAFSATETTGLWDQAYEIVGGDAGNMGNAAALTWRLNRLTISSAITVSSIDIDIAGSSTTGYFNRGETVRLTGVLRDSDAAGFYRVENPVGDTARSVKAHLYSTAVDEAGSVTTSAFTVSVADGTFSIDVAIPTTATDTYASSTANQAEAKGWQVLFFDATETEAGTGGNRATSASAFDVDANYYLSSSTRAWPTLMRDDQQRVTGTLVGVRSQTIPNTTPVTVDYVDGGSVNRGSCAATTTAGVTSNCDLTVSTAAASSPVGTWTSKYTVTASAGTSQNSMAVTNGQTFVVSATISLSGSTLDVDVAGSSTTKYFNRGESIRTAATLLHADGGAYNRKLAGGTTSARTATVHLYSGTAGSAGSVTSGSANVASATGVLTATSTDVALSNAFPDTYAAATHSQAESTEADMQIIDGGTGGNSDGNRFTQLNFYDVDANYYTSGSSLSDQTLNRGDTARTTASFLGVRGQVVPNGVTVTLRWRNPADTPTYSAQRTTTAGVSANYDQAFANTDAAGVWDFGFEVVGSDSGNSGNAYGLTWSITSLTLSSSITIASATPSIAYANRGESIIVTGVLRTGADDAFYQVQSPTGNSARSIIVQAYRTADGVGDSSSITSAAAAVSAVDGTFTATLNVPTTAPDTYEASTPGSGETKDWAFQIYDNGATAAGTSHNRASQATTIDTDANYYLSSSTRAWATLMRGDEQRMTGTLVGVRGTSVPAATPVEVAYLDSGATNRKTCATTTTSGVTSNCDIIISMSAAQSPIGTWASQYTVTAAAGTSQNSMAATNGQAFTLSRTLTLPAFDVDVAGQSTTKYFNLGETIRFTGTVLHADGNAYRAHMADGTTTARSVTLHAFANARGEAGSFTTQATNVDASTGAIAGTMTDTQVASTATDTYVDTVPNVGEARDWDVYVFVASVTNPSFETYTTTPGAPNGWTNLGGTGMTANRETSIVRSGANAVRIHTGSNSVDMGIYRTLPSLTAGEVYTASVWQRTDGQPNSQARIEIYDETAASAVASANGVGATTTYTQISTTFTPVDGHVYRVKLLAVEPATNNRELYFDDVRVENNNAATSNDGNAATQAALFDVDHEYHISASTRAWATLMRNDQQRVTGTIVGVRSQAVPNGIPVTVDYVDEGSVNRGTCAASTTSGTTANCDITISNTAASSPVGTWSSRYTIVASGATSQNFMAAAEGQTFVVSATIGLSAGTLDLDVAGSSTTKYFNRGESVRTAATLTHADAGPYRRLMADGTTEARTAAVHLYSGTAGGAGSSTSPAAGVALATGVLAAASTDLAIAATFPDTYAATSHGQSEATEADLQIIDGGAGSDSNGNRFTQADFYDVDSQVFIDQFYESDDNGDADDLDFNSADSDNKDPNTDYSRVYLKNVRGDLTNQFNGITVSRANKDPNTGATTSTDSLVLTSGAAGLYSGNYGAFPAWTTRRVDYTVTSADTNGNTAVAGTATKTLGQVHYYLARSTPSIAHAVRGDTEIITLDIQDSYADMQNDGTIDFDSTAAAGTFNVDLDVLLDDSTTQEGGSVNAAFTSGETFTEVLTSASTVDWRDLRWNIEQGELGGLEFHDSASDFNIHARQGTADNDGVYIVDDLNVVSVVTDQDNYNAGATITVTTTYAYQHASFSATTPANQPYSLATVTLHRPDNGALNSPAYVDTNTFAPTTTNAQGKTISTAVLTATAQAGAGYYAKATTPQNNAQDVFQINVALGTPVWSAHLNSNPANAYEATTEHNRGEEVRLAVPISNNPEGLTPGSSSATDDDAGGEILDSAGSWSAGPQTLEFIWTWSSTDAASEMGTPHAPAIAITLNGASSSTAPSQAANVYSKANFDVHTQKGDGLIPDDMTTDENEDKEFFIALDVVYVWVHAQNIRGEDWSDFPVAIYLTPEGSTTVINQYTGTTDEDGWTTAFLYSPQPPTGVLAIHVSSTTTGNSVETVETIEILSPNTDEYILQPVGWNNQLKVGKANVFQLRTIRYEKTTEELSEFAPDEEPRIIIEWSTGNGVWTRIVDAAMTHVAGTTYTYTWSGPEDSTWKDRDISVVYGAPFKKAWKYLALEADIIEGGGADPVKVEASPAMANPGETVTLVVHESFLDATARTGNAEGTFLYVYDPSGDLILDGVNPSEVGYGTYRHTFTLPGDAETGGWYVLAVTTDEDSGADNTAANTFYVEEDGQPQSFGVGQLTAPATLNVPGTGSATYTVDFTLVSQSGVIDPDNNQVDIAAIDGNGAAITGLSLAGTPAGRMTRTSTGVYELTATIAAETTGQVRWTATWQENGLTKKATAVSQMSNVEVLLARNNETQELIQRFWADHNATWDSWYDFYLEELGNETSLRAFIRQQHNLTRSQEAYNDEQYFQKYGGVLQEYSGYIVGGLGEEILKNREVINETKQQSTWGNLWNSIQADLLKYTIYGLLIIVASILVGNRRMRQIAKRFKPIQKVFDFNARRKARKAEAERQTAVRRAAQAQRGSGRPAADGGSRAGPGRVRMAPRNYRLR